MVDDTFSMIGRSVGKIRIIDVIGYGGMSAVYVGLDEKLERQVALKVIRRAHRVLPEERERFLLEARLLSSVDHPGVCQIFDYLEVDDCDFLVMELIEGRNLTKTLADGLTYSDKLEISRQVLDVLSTVHEHGVVHRDLKPDNVMLTPSGAVKVVDFGIALLADRQDSDERPASPPASEPARRARDSDVGRLMGTLRYMSPEQARGDAVTPATDIYSAGLLLQELFTEQPPQDQDAPMPVLLARAAEGESAPVTGLPPDLTELINRMKSVAPGGRPSARDAGEALQRIIDRPKRVRRRRLVATVWAALSLLSAGLAVQTVRAVVEARRASAARAEAEELVEFILGDLHGTLEPLGRLDLLGEITQRALAYYEQRPARRLAPDELDQHARALTKLAQVLEGQGDLERAEKAHRRAVEIRSDLLRREPDDSKRMLGLASSLSDLERVLYWQGRNEEARTILERAHALGQQLIEREPENADARRILGVCWDRLGSLRLEDGDLVGCQDAYERALEIDVVLFAEDPDDVNRWNLSLSRSRLGEVYLAGGDLEQALETFRTALELARGGPDEMRWRGLAADHRSSVAGVLEAGGDLKGALDTYREALAVQEQVARHDPTNLLAKNSEVWTRLAIGAVLRAQGKPRAALNFLEKALSEARALSAKDPRDAIYREAVAVSLSEIATVQRELGDHGDAERLHDEALGLRRDLLELDPGNAAWTVALATELLAIGEAHQARGKPDAAVAAWSRGLELVAPLATGSEYPAYRQAHARALLLLDRVDEARPIVEGLPSHLWHQRDFRELCMDHGIRPPHGWDRSR